MMFGLLNVSFSLPERKAVKMTFFASRFSIKSILLLVEQNIEYINAPYSETSASAPKALLKREGSVKERPLHLKNHEVGYQV